MKQKEGVFPTKSQTMRSRKQITRSIFFMVLNHKKKLRFQRDLKNWPILKEPNEMYFKTNLLS